MKGFILALVLTIPSIGAASVTNEKAQLCTAQAAMAGNIMSLRQDSVSKEQAIQIMIASIEDVGQELSMTYLDTISGIVDAAYKLGVGVDGYDARAVVYTFSMAVYDTCYRFPEKFIP